MAGAHPKCVNLEGGASVHGTRVQLWSNPEAAESHWQLELPLPSRRGGTHSAGCFRLRSRKADLHLAVPRSGLGGPDAEICVAEDADDDEDTESLWRTIERGSKNRAGPEATVSDPAAAARAEMEAMGIGSTSSRPSPVASSPRPTPARTSSSLYSLSVRQPSTRTRNVEEITKLLDVCLYQYQRDRLLQLKKMFEDMDRRIKPVEAEIGAMAKEYYAARDSRRKQRERMLATLRDANLLCEGRYPEVPREMWPARLVEREELSQPRQRPGTDPATTPKEPPVLERVDRLHEKIDNIKDNFDDQIVLQVIAAYSCRSLNAYIC